MGKYVKCFEGFINEVKLSDDDMVDFSSFDKFRYSIINHPSYKDSTLIVVGVEDDFEEQEDGTYKKKYKMQTNIMKITPDKNSFVNANGMKMRLQFQGGNTMLVQQWVSNDLADDMIDIIRKGGEEADFYLKTLVNHYLENTLGKKIKPAHR